MSLPSDVASVRCAALNPRPGVFAEIRWMPIAVLMRMPIRELEDYRFPSKLQHRSVNITIVPELFGFAEIAALCEEINHAIDDHPAGQK